MKHLVLFLFCLFAFTATAVHAEDSFRIAFGSCIDQRRDQPIWESVFATDPDAFIFLGDNVYGSSKTNDFTVLQQAYTKASETLPLDRLRDTGAVFAVWDDHDYGINDGGGDYPYKQTAQQVFLDFWDIAANDPRRMRDGIYFETMLQEAGKTLHIIGLDTRFFRSALKRKPETERLRNPQAGKYVPDPSPDKTMLGAAQWQWLDQVLDQPADVRLILSSVQVLADAHGWERWGNLPHERQRLLDMITAHDQTPTLFLSGDRHFSAFYKVTHRGQPLFEITASSLNKPNPNTGEPGPHRLFPPYGAENFATLDINGATNTALATIHNIAGQPVQTMVISLEKNGF